MKRPYQSPCSGWHCGPQWAQIPNFALRYHSGTSYCLSDSHEGWNLPGATGSALSLILEANWGASAATSGSAAKVEQRSVTALFMEVLRLQQPGGERDRKSTRLNSSHLG